VYEGGGANGYPQKAKRSGIEEEPWQFPGPTVADEGECKRCVLRMLTFHLPRFMYI
jgi:hypothetical protein